MDRTIANLDRVETTGNIDARHGLLVDALKVLGKSLRVNRRRRNNELKVGTLRQDFSEVAQEEVDVQTALMRFVNDDRIVGFEQSVPLSLSKQDAVRHELNRRTGL